jgi:hypothetical protein
MGSTCGTHGKNEKCAKSLGDKYESKGKFEHLKDIITVYTRERSVGCVGWISCSGEDPVAGICDDVNEQ